MGAQEHAAVVAEGGRTGRDGVDPDRYVIGFEELDATQLALVGGKGAQLAQLARTDGVRVPPGFCVTTNAFRRSIADAPELDDLLDRLARPSAGDGRAIRGLAAQVRLAVEGIGVADDVAAAISRALARLGGDEVACAVRSSATAEDLPTASFAGQHESYLGVVGPAAVVEHVSRVWGSLFTERAVAYRLRHGVDQRAVEMAVVVQRMVAAAASGVLFTADPVTCNRRVASVEATVGLGEALVGGLANADSFKVRDGEVIARAIATKRLAVRSSPAGGTQRQPIEAERRRRPALTDDQVLRLAELGRRVEARLGGPQDIEWCLADDGFELVQSRPITTLFPIPASDDRGNRVYVSVGHQQMMTDPMRPLGLSLFALTAMVPMHEAGGRLFVDVTERLAAPASRTALLDVLGRSDPLIGDALRTIVERDGFIAPIPDDERGEPRPGAAPAELDADPAIVADLIGRGRDSLAALERDIATRSGAALTDFIRADLAELKRIMFDPRSRAVIMTANDARSWLNEQLEGWLGERNAADTLTRSVPNNITSQMGLALLDVADVIRPCPDVVSYLQGAGDDFLDGLDELAGGRRARDAIRAYLATYGMRCVGEIDITRPRWSERPSTILPALLGNVRNFEAGAGRRRLEQGRREARAKEQALLDRVRSLPGGERKAAQAKRMIDRVRTFAGYREYPKYAIASRYLVYKRALLAEAEELVRAGVLREVQDAFHLTFAELEDVVRTRRLDGELVSQRKRAFESHSALAVPRVLTSEGEVVDGAYRRDDVPRGALVGLAVSGGTIEGRARVVLDIEQAKLEPGDVLVTAYTDPSWSPLFLAVEGLVTEVGGAMTHGAVIAREYGLPAVVGVEHATRLIADGQRIRVHGTDGFVELLPFEPRLVPRRG